MDCWLEFMLGRKLTPEDPKQLPQDKILNEMRRKHVESGDPCLKAAMGLTEGGGASTFREASKLSGGELEERLAAAMKIIHDDEKDHYEDAAAEAARLAKTEEDVARMRKAIREVSIQRVLMRNEQFGFPMSDDEVDTLIADNPL